MRSAAYFIFDGGPGHYVGSYQAGENDPAWPYEVYSWPPVMERVGGWLNDVKRDLETPDLWSELRRERDLLGGALDETVENTPFTSEEQAQIEAKLEEMKAYVRQAYELTDEQSRAIEARLDYLVHASRRLGRIDWRNALVGAFLGAVVQATLPPEPVRDILGLALRGLAQLFGGMDIPALPPP